MANEAQVQCSLQIRKGNVTYRSQPTSFNAAINAAVAKGPTPSAVTASVAGTDVDLSGLTKPGLCRIMNLDNTNYVTVGIWDAGIARFYPMLKALPGESYVVRLSDALGKEWAGTGTAVADSDQRLRIKANAAPCVVLVDAFED